MVKFLLRNVKLDNVVSNTSMIKKTNNKRKFIVRNTLDTGKQYSLLDVKTPIILNPNLVLKNSNSVDCEYNEECGRDCDYDRYPIEEHPIGIPIRYENIQSKDGKNIEIFHMIYYYCSVECCYSAILEEKKKIPKYRDYDVDKAMQLLMKIFNIIYPGKTLKPAKDRMLLMKTGYGDMSISEFRQPSLDTMVKNNNIKFVKCYIEYDLNKCLYT